jgi:hypothetical protein
MAVKISAKAAAHRPRTALRTSNVLDRIVIVCEVNRLVVGNLAIIVCQFHVVVGRKVYPRVKSVRYTSALIFEASIPPNGSVAPTPALPV